MLWFTYVNLMPLGDKKEEEEDDDDDDDDDVEGVEDDGGGDLLEEFHCILIPNNNCNRKELANISYS